MTQREVARAAGLDPALLSRIESGKNDFLISTIERVLEVLGFELGILLRKERPIPEGEVDNEKRKETVDVG